MSGDERKLIDAYARKLGIDATGLLNLLLRREVRVAGRLPALVSTYGRSGEEVGSSKVTAHLSGTDVGARFGECARASGVSVSAAARALLRAELQERDLAAWAGVDDSF
jgi:hypothetical protein